ncbi:O-antigen ligase family protein [Affinirhizobium pseudoryzae]|uniref:O-antigen ligase family protein n=1 Tax=Allorhizobium pseudoryzae TaxID=379684 RepID=UPI0013EE322C|nr:O-antigen ligase family protein [Allorhizobium pseudoryzae]
MRPVPGSSSLSGEAGSFLPRQLRRVALACFILAMTVSLLSHGAVYPAASAVALLLLLLATLLAGVVEGIQKSNRRSVYWLLGLWWAIVLYSLVLAAPLPAFISGHPAWSALRDVGIEATKHFSPAPANVIEALVPIGIPFATALSALLLFKTDRDIDKTLQVFAFTGALFATVAIIQFSFFPKVLMFAEKRFYIGSLTAPFVNRNTAATFYGLTLVAQLCQFRIKALADMLRSGGPAKRSIPIANLLMISAAIVTFIALLLTNSRAGIFSTAVGVAIYVAGNIIVPAPAKPGMGFARSTTRTRGRQIIYALGGLVLVLMLFWLYGGRAALRAEIQGLDDGRFCILPGVWRAIGDNLWTGIGPGVFGVYFPAYRDPACGLGGFWELAHNFYLDGFLAFGLVFWIFIGAGIGILVVSCAEGLRNRRSRRPIVWAGIASSFIVAVHATLDFSIQIPGFSSWWALLIALVLTTCTGRTKYRSKLTK